MYQSSRINETDNNPELIEKFAREVKLEPISRDTEEPNQEKMEDLISLNEKEAILDSASIISVKQELNVPEEEYVLHEGKCIEVHLKVEDIEEFKQVE